MRHTKIQLQQFKNQQPKFAKGIGLLEVMLFLFIVGATLAVGFAWLTAKQQSERAEARTAILQQANRYIEAFTAANNRLPCPAVDLGGVENCFGERTKGYLPYVTINFDASQLQRGTGQLRYLVNPGLTKQSDRLLVVDPLNKFEPAKWDDTPTTPSTFSFNQVSTADYCRSLATLGNEVSVRNPAGGNRTVAYAIADSGGVDEDNDGSLFDGINADLTVAQMEAPEKTKVRGSYDDQVLARTPTDLGFNSDCTSLMMSLNMMALGVGVVQAAADSKESAKLTIGFQAAIGIAQAAAIAGSFLESSIALAAAIVDLAAATTGLTVASAACAVLVGCAAIPQFTAAVILCSAAIVASVAAMAVGAASFIPQIVYVAAVIAVGITVGVSASQSVDLVEIRRIAQEGYTAARASTAQARADYNQALSNSALRRGARTLAYNNLVQAARNVISNTNAVSVPVGTTPLTALDPQIAAFVAAADAKNEAEFNVETSREAVKTARRDVVDFQQALDDTRALAVANPTNTEYPARVIELQLLVDQKNAALAASIAAEAAAPGAVTSANNALIAARSALVAAGNRPYCVNSDCSFVFSGGGSLNTASFQYLIADADYAPDAKRLIALKRAVDEAEAAEEQSRLALEQVNALSTGTTPTGTETQLWAGAVEILRAADAKGGSK